MTIINSLKINKNASSIEVDAQIPVDFTESRLLLWDIDTFKDYEKAIDLSSLIKGTDNNAIFDIPSSEVNLKTFSGLFFLEFSELDTTSQEYGQKVFGLVSNFMNYHECLLNKVLSIDISNCEKIDSDCDGCGKNIYLLSTLISSLEKSIHLNFYSEAISIIRNIETLCDICPTCPDYGEVNLVSGTGYGIENGDIILN